MAKKACTTGLVCGLLFALKQLADSLGLTAALGKTRLAKLALFPVLAHVAHQGSRLSAEQRNEQVQKSPRGSR